MKYLSLCNILKERPRRRTLHLTGTSEEKQGKSVHILIGHIT